MGLQNMYYRKLQQGLNAKGTLIPENEDVYKHIKTTDKDYYISLHKYSEEQKELFYKEIEKIKKGKLIKTINGAADIHEVFTDRLVFDFDSEDDLNQARLDTIELCNRLLNEGLSEENIEVTFSGNKGFCIELLTEHKFTPEEVKSVTKQFAEGLKTFDGKIFNASRIIRVPHTKHPKSKLYKTPILLEELSSLSMEEIVELAQQEFEPDSTLVKCKLPKSVLGLRKEKTKKGSGVKVTGLDLNKKPKWLSNWKFALQEGFFPAGSRNDALLILAATYQGQGFNKITAYRMLKGAAQLQSDRYGQERYSDQEIWKEIIEEVYNTTWNGGTYAEDNFPDSIVEFFQELKIPRGEEPDEQETLIEDIESGFDEFVEYANRIDEYTMKFGIDPLDEKLKVRKGHLIFLLAPPGVGKTSFAVTMLNNMSKRNTGSYFGSYDMYKNNVYQKLLQRHTGLHEEDIYDVFRERNTKQIEKFRHILKEEYKNVSFCFKVGQSIGDLKRSIAREEEKRGIPIELVVVDYLELILTEANDPTAASAEAAQGLREIANEGRVVIGLLQPNKMNSTPDEPIKSYNGAKGSSTIAQSGTAILTAHRPGMDSENDNVDDNFFSINCVKNRNGSLFALDFAWDGQTQTISELDDTQRAELGKLRKQKSEKKITDSII